MNTNDIAIKLVKARKKMAAQDFLAVQSNFDHCVSLLRTVDKQLDSVLSHKV
jgi:hypothetical protein